MTLATVYGGILARGAAPLVPGHPGWSAPVHSSTSLDQLRWMLRQDQLGYLHDDILTKVDRAAMAWSLETRAPFLDHRIGCFAWRLPSTWLMSHGVGKRVLRRILARHLPPALFERPKMGFAMPLDVWLLGPLRPWAEALLAPSALAACPWLDAATVQRLWRRFLAVNSTYATGSGISSCYPPGSLHAPRSENNHAVRGQAQPRAGSRRLARPHPRVLGDLHR